MNFDLSEEQEMFCSSVERFAGPIDVEARRKLRLSKEGYDRERWSQLVELGLIALAAKNLIGKARPEFYDGAVLWVSQPLADSYLYASFPSGHSTTVAALAAAVFLTAPRLAWIATPFALWIAFTRLITGAHFPSDVVAGMLLGVFFTWIHARIFAKRRLLFEFDDQGRLRSRNLSAKRARRRIRARNQPLVGLGFEAYRKASSNSN